MFDGYHSIPFSSGGALIAGASGSGKSSLLDAISLGFLPFNRRNFNASGDNTAAGSSAGRRTVDKYVRGAWGQRSDGGTSRVMYLRGDGTAWSAVAVTYASDTGRTVTGLVLKWLTGESRNDSSSRFVLGDGDLDIEDVCNRWAAGRFDAGVFKEDWRFSTKVESQYLAQLYATIGIRASDAAQQLLGKAKSLKSVGGLEQFVREFMLDEPDSLARLPEALKQIDPLVEARELLAVAQKKRKILGDIEQIQQRYASESSDLGIIDLVDAPMVRAYTDHVRLAQCPTQIATLDGTIDQLENEYEDVTRQPESRQGRSGFAQRADQRVQREHRAAAVAGDRRRDRGRAGGRAGAPPTRTCSPPRTSRSRTPPTSSGTCVRNCSPRPPSCSPRSNATARRPPTPSTRRSPPASPATTPPRNSSASSTSAPRCRSSRSRCATTSAPPSVPTPPSCPTSPN